METNPVYLVSTVERLRIHCYATVKFRVVTAPIIVRATSLPWSSANIRAPHQTPAGPRPTRHSHSSLLRPLCGFDGSKPFLLQLKQQRDSCRNHAGDHRSDRAVGESSSTSGGSLVNSASFVVSSLSRIASVTAVADLSKASRSGKRENHTNTFASARTGKRGKVFGCVSVTNEASTEIPAFVKRG